MSRSIPRIVGYAPPTFSPSLQPPPFGMPPGIIPGMAGSSMQLGDYGAADDRRLRRWRKREARLRRRLAKKRQGSKSYQRISRRIAKLQAKIRQISGGAVELPGAQGGEFGPGAQPADPGLDLAPATPPWLLPAAIAAGVLIVAVAATQKRG
jgi:hypothetical protein